MSLTAVSLFAGIGGFDLAMRRAGVHVAAAVEIDEGCRGNLRRHFPETKLFNDVTEVTGDQLRAAGFVPGRGILAGGWPCQDLSVAGRRAGLDGARSGLFWHVVRLAGELRPRWLLLENVPGLLSAVCPCPGDDSCTRAGRAVRCGRWEKRNGVRVFTPNVRHTPKGGACLYGCMETHGGAMGAVVGSLEQLGYGLCWRVLDAQYFGVPQRRDRVFFAGCLGDGAAPVEVLLEPESGDGNPAPRRAPGARASGTPQDCPGEPGVIGTLGTTGPGGGWRIGADEAAAGQLIAFDAAQITHPENRVNPQPGDPAPPLAAAGQPMVALAVTSSMQRLDGTVETLIAHALTSEGADASEDGTGRGLEVGEDNIAYAIRSGGDGHTGDQMGYVMVRPLLEVGARTGTSTDDPRAGIGIGNDGDPMFTLQAGKQHGVAVPLDLRNAARQSEAGETAGTGIGDDGDPSFTLSATGRALPGVAVPTAVRRLTPLECERLQGFPEITKALRIEVWRCSDHPKSLALADSQNPKSQRSAPDADMPGSRNPAQPAGSHSQCFRPDPALPVAASVHIDCEASAVQIRSPDGRHWSVDGAALKKPSPLAALLDVSALLFAPMPHGQEQAISTGRAASPPSLAPSIPQPSGAICVLVCGLEIGGAASAAHKSGPGEASHSTSTTPRVGRATQHSGLKWTTLCCSALRAIDSFIPLPTPETTSYAIELTASAGWTRWDADGAEQSDSARYRRLGNAVAVPVVEWISRRIVAAEARLSATRGAA